MAFLEGQPIPNQDALDEFIQHGKTGQIFDAEKGILVSNWVTPALERNIQLETEEIPGKEIPVIEPPQRTPLLRRLIPALRA